MAELVVGQSCDGVSDRAEIIDDDVAVDVQPLLDQGRTDHPGIVGQLQDFAADGPGEGERQLIGQIDLLAFAELLPGELEARVLGRLQSQRLVEREHATVLDFSQSEAGVGPADVGDRDRPHALSASIAVSIAEAPLSA